VPGMISEDSSTPKYILAEEAIRKAIADGRYGKGDRLPSERNLAQKFGIAPLTVRQAVDRLVDAGILQRRPRVGTFVSAEPNTRNIALLIFDVPKIEPGTLPDRELETLRSMAAEENRDVRVMVLLSPLPSPEQVMSELRVMGVGAVGFLGFSNNHRDFINTITRTLPGVLFNKSLPGVQLPCAKANYGEAGRIVIDYFVRRGRKNIGMCANRTDHAGFMELAAVAESELHRRGLAVNNDWWYFGDPQREPGGDLAWLKHLLARGPRPEALIVTRGENARVIREELARRGRRLGLDMDVVVPYSGVDPENKSDPCPLIALDYAESSRLGAEMLLKLASDPESIGGAPVVCSKPRLAFPKALPDFVRNMDMEATSPSE